MMRIIFEIAALMALVVGLACFVIDSIRDHRGIKEHGFMEYMVLKGGRSRMDKAFPLLMLSAILLIWASRGF